MRKPMVVGLMAAVVWMNGLGASAQEGNDRARQWKAEWITMAGVPARDEVVLHFRKVIELTAIPQHFAVHVSADNQFVFYVNGKRVGTGPAKSDLAHWRYETYELAPFLKAGKNVLAATVWNFGTHAALAQMSDRTGFLVHGEGSAERVADTNASWEVEQEKGIVTLPTELPGFYYVAGPGEQLDAKKFDWSFASDEVKDKSTWSMPVTLGRGALRWERDAPNNWQLVSDPLPAMEMREVTSGKLVRTAGTSGPGEISKETVTVPARTKASFLVDHSELVAGYPELLVSGGAGAKVRLTYAEALYDDKGQKGNRDEIKGKHIFGVADEFVAGGEQKSRSPVSQPPLGMTNAVFMPLGWRTWRYLQIDVETGGEPVTIGPLKTWFSAYPFEEKGYFRCDDASLNKIWEIGWRTARVGAHDTYTDAPYWERLQYVGDTRIEANISYAVAGDDRLARQAIDAINNSRIPDGLTQSRYPSSLVQMIPTFSLMWVGMVHDFWMYRGDAGLEASATAKKDEKNPESGEEFVKTQLPGVRAVMGWYLARQRADGLLGKIPWWPFVDWGKDFEDGVPPQEADGESSVITLQYLEALRYAAELEEHFGDKHQAEIYREAGARAAQGVWKLCWDAHVGLLADTPAKRHYSQHANILGVWLDVIPAEKQKSVMNALLGASEFPGQSRPRYQIPYDQSEWLPKMTLATYYFRFYLARAVEHAGMGDLYLELLWPWREMMKLGLTTWAEQPEPTRSDSHAWSAHPNFDLLRIVAGIQPASAGFQTVRIEPHVEGLTRVEAGMPTPKGMIEVKYSPGQAEVSLPEGMTGELIWNGKTVALHGGQQTVK
jgi:alpha-L-rhamnosidase